MAIGAWYLCNRSLACALTNNMMMSSNGNIFRVTGHLCGEFTGHRWIPAQRPVAQSFDVFFDLRLNERFSKQSWGWWFETLSRPLWRRVSVKMEKWGFWLFYVWPLHQKIGGWGLYWHNIPYCTKEVTWLMLCLSTNGHRLAGLGWLPFI